MLHEAPEPATQTDAGDDYETTSNTQYCDRCTLEEVKQAGDLCPDCTETTRTAETDAILAKNGVTREQVGTNGNGAMPEVKLQCVNPECKWKGAAGRVDEFAEKSGRHGRFCRRCEKPVYPVTTVGEGNGVSAKDANAALDRTAERIQQVSGLGLKWNEVHQSFVGLDGINVGIVDIKCDDDAQFARTVESISNLIQSNGNGRVISEGEKAAGARMAANFRYGSSDLISESAPLYDGDPGADWAEKLGAEYKAARHEAEIVESDFPEYPAEFVRSLVKENNKITKTEVFSVIAEFRMNVSLGEVAEKAKAIVVTKREEKALMKQARELRLTLRKERLRIENVRVNVKEPYLRRVQVIDGIGKTIRDMFQDLEGHLKTQEDFIKLDDERIAAEKQAERIEALSRFEWTMPIEGERPDLGAMSDELWLAFHDNIEQAYNDRKAEAEIAERERLQREEQHRLANEKLTRNNERLRSVQAIGFIPVAGKLQFFALPADTDVNESAVTESTDADFAATLKYLETKAEEFRAIQARNHERTLQLVDIGMRRDGQRYSFENVRIDIDALETATAIEWAETLASATAQIEAIKATREQAATAMRELEEKARSAREESIRPDKEKADAYFKRVYDASATFPKVADQRIAKLIDKYFDSVANLTNALAKQVDDLA